MSISLIGRPLSSLFPNTTAISTQLKPKILPTSCLDSQIGSVRYYPGGGRLKTIKRRRKTVTTIGKLTKTMSVVAASKMVPAQQKAAAVSPFYTSMSKQLKDITGEPEEGEKVLTLVISTDKGLCGATNNGMTRALLKHDLSNHSIVIWGDKGCGAFERSLFKQNVVFSAHPNQKTILSFAEVSAVTERLAKLDFDVARVVFNQMVSSSSPAIQYINIPSLKRWSSDKAKNALTPYEIEATADDELIVSLYEYFFAAGLNYACFHNQAVEMFARRNSMDNATKNAKEVGRKLQLKFNRERQAMITTELGEITSGAAAVDEMSKR